MIELNGWFEIQFSTDGETDGSPQDKLAIAKLLEDYQGFNQFVELKNVNGSQVLFICIKHNHDNGTYNSIYTLLSQIASIAKGSYGLLHARFSEEELAFNEFKVLKMLRGKLIESEDYYFSPCKPAIED